MPCLARRRPCLFLVVSVAALLLPVSSNGEARRDQADNGVARFRLLLGLNNLGGLSPRQRPRHSPAALAPASAPAPAPAPDRAHLPLLHKNARLPDPAAGRVVTHDRKRGNDTTRNEDGGHGDGKKSMQLVVVAAAAALSGAVVVLLVVLVVFLACRKVQRRRSGADQDGASSSNKVGSFDPGPNLFYVDAVKPYTDAGQEHDDGAKAPEMAGPKDEAEVPDREEESRGVCSEDDEDGAGSVHSSCCFQSSHFAYSELRDAKQGECVSPSPASARSSRRRSSAPATPADKKKVAGASASPLSPQCPRTPSNNQDRVRRAVHHSPSSSESTARMFLRFPDVQGSSARHAKEAEAGSVRSDAVSGVTADRKSVV